MRKWRCKIDTPWIYKGEGFKVDESGIAYISDVRVAPENYPEIFEEIPEESPVEKVAHWLRIKRTEWMDHPKGPLQFDPWLSEKLLDAGLDVEKLK